MARYFNKARNSLIKSYAKDSKIANRRLEIKCGFGISQKEKYKAKHDYNFDSEFRNFKILSFHSNY